MRRASQARHRTTRGAVHRITAPHRAIVVRSIGVGAPRRARATAGRAPLSHTPLTAT
ncbi:hypothetical protein [Streptomyces fungicidicus]|uniref:hypothetical protein n=1 Tax=Streptomyces fungicidicus TaxID=68203 RepID=UPI003D75D96D